MKKTTNLGYKAVITDGRRGLYYGTVTATDAAIIKTRSMRVRDCRHIGYWKGSHSGITSLAAQGPAKGSRIGFPADSLLTGLAHVHRCTEEAQQRFAAILP